MIKRFLPLGLLLQGCTGESENDGIYRADSNFSLGGEVSCADPVEGFARFSEEGAIRGFTVPLEFADLEGVRTPGLGGDLIATDLDADGDVDLIVGGLYGRPHVYENDGHGYFTMHDPTPIALANQEHAQSMTFGSADLNGDLLPEIIHGGTGHFGVIINKGSMEFEEGQKATFGSQIDKPHNVTHTVGDADQDGDLDLFIPSNGPSSDGGTTDPDAGSPDFLFLLDSENAYVQGLSIIVGEEGSRSQTAVFTDRDADGDMDLMVLADLGPPSSFFRNDGVDSEGLPIFVDDSEAISANLQMSAMGIDSADLNQDGVLDYCASDVGLPKCLVSDGSGGYYEAHEAMGLSVDNPVGKWDTVGWSVDLTDLDNDGLLDLIQASGPDQSAFANGETELPDIIWRQNPDGTFEDVSAEIGIDSVADHIGMATADFNGDGYLDIVLAGPGTTVDLHMNQCGSNAWLDVELIGPEENSEGIGAQVSVAWEDKVETREIYALRAHGQTPSRAHFGFGALEQGWVDHLEVRWPDGHISTAENVPARRQVIVRHPDSVDRKFESNVEAKPFYGDENSPGNVYISGHIYDLMTDEPLKDIEVWKKDEPETIVVTDSGGNFTIKVPGDQPANLMATDEGMVEMLLAIHPAYQTSADEGIRFTLLEQELLEALYIDLTGVELDPAKSTILVSLIDPAKTSAFGATVNLTAEYEAVMSIGPGSATEGSTLQDGDKAILYFNVTHVGSNLPILATSATGTDCMGTAFTSTAPGKVVIVPLFCP